MLWSAASVSQLRELGGPRYGLTAVAVGLELWALFSLTRPPGSDIPVYVLGLVGASHPSKRFVRFSRAFLLFFLLLVMWRQEMFSLQLWWMIMTIYF